jgi:hypothetical protein
MLPLKFPNTAPADKSGEKRLQKDYKPVLRFFMSIYFNDIERGW